MKKSQKILENELEKVKLDKDICEGKFNLLYKEKEELREKAEKVGADKSKGSGRNKDYRKIYPANFRCKSGVYVRSKSEREIHDFFFEHRIRVVYEEQYRHPTTGKTAMVDFYLPDYNLYMEYFGRTDSDYLKDREKKINMYRSDSKIHFEYLTYEDDNNIYDKLKGICYDYSIPLKQ